MQDGENQKDLQGFELDEPKVDMDIETPHPGR